MTVWAGLTIQIHLHEKLSVIQNVKHGVSLFQNHKLHKNNVIKSGKTLKKNILLQMINSFYNLYSTGYNLFSDINKKIYENWQKET